MPNEARAKMSSSDNSMARAWMLPEKGMTTIEVMPGIIASTGASRKMMPSTLLGTSSCLDISLRPSASGWSRPS